MMTTQLRIAVGQSSVKGRKAINQDCSGIRVPAEPLLESKGVVAALADGISSSDVSHVASETAVCGFLEDYFATPESWSVKTSAQRVLNATNSWLYAQTRNGPNRYELDRGYVCTFSAIIVKSATVHIFHVGDARIYYLAGHRLEQLTEDHRLWMSPEKSYLSRALGMGERLEIDYQSYPLEVGDTFVLMTDGVYEFAQESFLGEAGTNRSDLFSLGVIAYQMLSGRTPYGAQIAKATTRVAQRRLVYRPVLDEKRAIPAWIDGALRKAVQVNPRKRYEELSEFVYDLRHPNESFLHPNRAPLLERNPLLFWKGVSFILFVIVIVLLSTIP